MKHVRLLLLPVTLCAVLGVYSARELWKASVVQANSTAEPESVTLAELLDRKLQGNRNVRVRGFQFGPKYVYQTVNSSWKDIWVPVFAEDGRAALIKSRHVHSEAEMERFATSSEITGVITNKIDDLGEKELKVLQQGYPTLQFKSIVVIEDRANYADPRRIPALYLALITGGMTLGVCGIAWWFLRRPLSPPDLEALSETRPDETVGLGKLLAVFRERLAGRAYIITAMLVFGLTLGSGPLLVLEVLTNLQDRFGCLALLAIGFGLSIAGMCLARSRLRNQLWVFDGGFCMKSGSAVCASDWGDVMAISNRFTYRTEEGWESVGPFPILRLRGERMVTLLTEADKPFEMGRVVQELVYNNLHTRIKDRLEDGHDVPFGDVTLSANGVQRAGDGSILPWYRVESIQWDQDPKTGELFLVIRRTESHYPWLSVAAMNQDNIGLFMQLANLYLGVFEEPMPPTWEP